MKRITLFLAACCMMMALPVSMSAQNESQPGHRVTLNQGGYAGATFTVTVSMPTVKTQKVEAETFATLSWDGSTHLFRDGEPDLPVVSQVIEVPLCSGIEVSVSNVQTRSLQLDKPMMPMQPAPSKADKGPRPFVMDSALYATDAVYAASEVAWVDVIGVARDRRLAALRVSPVSYNPVTGVAEVVTSLHVTLTYQGVDEAATRTLHERYYSPAFSCGSSVLATLPADKSVSDAAPLHYLIVAHSSFRGKIDDFVNWKRRRGMIVTVGYTDDPAVGTTSTSIANYVKNFYTNATAVLPAPTYLLIVGDHDQVPAFSSRCSSPASDHITDLYYVTWDNDNVPDCYRGRFSAQNLTQLTPQIDKTLLYEGYNFSDASYLTRGVLIAGVDGGYSGDNAYTYADPTMDYVAKTYVNLSNGFRTVKYYKNNTSFHPDGVSVTGSSQATATGSALRNLYNTGYGWVNYSAHGSETSWGDPEFTTSHVASMSNSGMPGIFIGNCCLTGKFEVSNCFGESLLRRGNNAGAVAYIGATNSTYWPHDFCWTVGVRSNFSNTMNTSYDASHLGMYDRLFHTHGENYTLWHNSLGSMITAGNMAVNAYGSYTLYYWEIYQLFGDPSVIPWLGTPADMPFDGASTVMVGVNSYTFNTAPRAYVALTTGDDHTLVAAAYADPTTGEVSLPLSSDITPGNYEIAIWAQGYKPFFTNLTVIVPSGPYLSAVDMQPAAGHILPGQANLFDVTIINNGVDVSRNASVDAVPLSDGVVALSPVNYIPVLASGETTVLHSAVSLFVPAGYTDGDAIQARIEMMFGNRTSSRVFTFNVSAPHLTVSEASATPFASDAAGTVTCTLTNTGAVATGDLTLTLVNAFNMVATAPQPVHVGVLQPGQSTSLTFNMTMADNLPECTIPFNLMASEGNGSYLVDEFLFNGPGSSYEDFETGDFSLFPWQQGTNAWEITTAQKHSGTYSARSKTNLSNRGKSQLTLSWSSVAADSISFWYKVSSEEDYDFFTFYIDGTSKLQASGTSVTAWQRASFPVAAGTHTFRFEYSKDRYSVEGSDCAWIDDISLPFSGTPTRFVYDTICQNADYTFAGQPLPTGQLGDFVYVDSSSSSVIVRLALNVAEAPEVTVTTSGSMLPGGRAVLTAHGATSYLWSTGDTTASIVVSPDSTSEYIVTGFRGGCSSIASAQIIVGIHNSQPTTLNSQLKVYPNPTDGILHVVCPDARRISVVNLMGQVVLTLNSQDSTLNLEFLPEGVYFLKVETSDGVAVKKILKK